PRSLHALDQETRLELAEGLGIQLEPCRRHRLAERTQPAERIPQWSREPLEHWGEILFCAFGAAGEQAAPERASRGSSRERDGIGSYRVGALLGAAKHVLHQELRFIHRQRPELDDGRARLELAELDSAPRRHEQVARANVRRDAKDAPELLDPEHMNV